MAVNQRQEAKILDRIKASLEQGDFYEAHQRYRALYFRMVSQDRITDALSMLYNGASELFSKEQIDSGTDLSLLFLSVLREHKVAVSKENIERICRLHSLIRHDHPDRVNFVNGAVKWTSDACKRKPAQSRTGGTAASQAQETSDALVGVDLQFVGKYGHPDVHRGFAMNHWKEKNYPESRQHFLLSNDGASCGAMLIEFQQCVGFSTEVDLFIAQAVFHYLCMKRIAVAKEALKSYTTLHPDISKSAPPFRYPLLNFLYFLILNLEQPNLTVYTILCEQYAVVLRRDPIYFKHLERIGNLFYDMPPAETASRSQPGGFLGGLMNTLFSSITGGDDDDELVDGEDGDDDDDDNGEVYEVASESLPSQPQHRPAFDRHNDVD